jgi:hypothetical protein
VWFRHGRRFEERRRVAGSRQLQKLVASHGRVVHVQLGLQDVTVFVCCVFGEKAARDSTGSRIGQGTDPLHHLLIGGPVDVLETLSRGVLMQRCTVLGLATPLTHARDDSST